MKLFCVVISFCFLFSSCSKTITVSPPAYQGKLSIQSLLQPDSLPVVYLNRTVPYFDKAVRFSDLVVRNAVVRISPGASVDVLTLDSTYDLLSCQFSYYYKGHAPIQLNQTYTLSIASGSETYSARASTALTKATIDSVAYTPSFNDLYGEHEGVIVYFKDPLAQANYYRYEMDRYIDTSTKRASANLNSPCLGKDSLFVQELGRSVYSDQGQSGGQIKIVIEPAYLHKAGTKGTVYIQTIGKDAYDFFDQLDKQKLAQYNPFVEPVFLRQGQFGSKAIGYFSAMVKSSPVAFVYPE
jgi:hypothetical protein